MLLCPCVLTCVWLQVDEESVDAVTLFTYLKLEQHIPKNVFCSVELNCASNMAGTVVEYSMSPTVIVIFFVNR